MPWDMGRVSQLLRRWKALVDMSFPLSRPINLLVIHHSASPRMTSLQQIQQWHRNKGWREIGYHFVIDGSGQLQKGRPVKEAGAHAMGHNTHSLGICVTGNNTKREDRWSDYQKDALVSFVKGFRVFFPVAEIVGHRDLHGSKTLCPGLDVCALLKERGAL